MQNNISYETAVLINKNLKDLEKNNSELFKYINKLKKDYPDNNQIDNLYNTFLSDLIHSKNMIPSYFIDMMNESNRVKKFKNAIDNVVSENSDVLEIGGGTGIMSCFASKKVGKNKKVYCYEVNPVMVDISRNVIKDNDCNVEVIEKISVEGSSDEINGKKDILICETIGNYLIEENILTIVNHAHDTFLNKNATILPKSGKIFGCSVEFGCSLVALFWVKVTLTDVFK